MRIVLVVFAALAMAGAGWLQKQKTDAAQMQPAVERLQAEIQELRQERELPARILQQVRPSICYLYIQYRYADANARLHVGHVSGSGFVVAEGWIATSRHVAEPGYRDGEDKSSSSIERLERLAFFPGETQPVRLDRVKDSEQEDIAIIHFDSKLVPHATPLGLAGSPPAVGDPIMLVGYPLGVDGMLAKAAQGHKHFSADDLAAARKLAAASLLRPWATQGHVGDVVGNTLVYDAATTHGGSGGPVLNAQGRVLAVNSAYVVGFSGGSVGISASAIKPLLRKISAPQTAQRLHNAGEPSALSR